MVPNFPPLELFHTCVKNICHLKQFTENEQIGILRKSGNNDCLHKRPVWKKCLKKKCLHGPLNKILVFVRILLFVYPWNHSTESQNALQWYRF